MLTAPGGVATEILDHGWDRPMPKSLLAEMATALRANLLPTVVYSVMVTALPLLFENPAGNTGTSFAVSTLYLYFIHRQVLFGTNARLQPPVGTVLPKDSIGRFFLVTLLLCALILLPAALAAYFWARGLEGAQFLDQFLGMTIVVMIPLMWVLFAAIGTLLPAAASRVPFSLAQALRAGRKSGLRVAMQLAVLPGLALVAVLALVILVARLLGPLGGAAQFAMDAAVQAIVLIPSIMTVAILVRAFRTSHVGGQGAMLAQPPLPQTPS
jgi:hypothetical protein